VSKKESRYQGLDTLKGVKVTRQEWTLHRRYSRSLIMISSCDFTDAYTTNDVNYTWKGGSSQGIEIVSSEMAQFDLTNVKTHTKSQTNSKGKTFSKTPK
jgi:hypothetical protein